MHHGIDGKALRHVQYREHPHIRGDTTEEPVINVHKHRMEKQHRQRCLAEVADGTAEAFHLVYPPRQAYRRLQSYGSEDEVEPHRPQVRFQVIPIVDNAELVERDENS